ncbi:MAG: hydratase [SAR202 cluster bacterium]|nr:hydratase [SAR202 cluster bacterium]|tara:strand:+ start:41883 stop:42674 length:792 start_codon:yes stop_codon:yes gene_type:complete
MDQPISREVVKLLSQARLNKVPLSTLSRKFKPKSELDAYNIQSLLHKDLASLGYGDVVGRKIGCTSKIMQDYLGIKTPCVGGMFSSKIQQNQGEFYFDDFIRPGVECEIAVIIGDDLGDDNFLHDRYSVENFVSSVMCAIEIVDDRWVDYEVIDVYSLIADDFFASGCVLGEYNNPSAINLSEIRGDIFVNDQLVGSGIGRDIMDHPFEALAWLANFCSKRGDFLRKGEVISLGSIVKTIWIEKFDRVKVSMGELGDVEVNFL